MSILKLFRGAIAGPRIMHQRAFNYIRPTLIARTVSSGPSPRVLINENIPFDTVQVVNPETRKPDPPTSFRPLLGKLDKKRGDYYALVDQSHQPAPLIVLRNRKMEFDKRKAAKAASKVRKTETKILEMTWSIEPGDLSHKLSKAKSHLEKGDSVEILFKPKRKVALPPPDHMKKLIADVEAEMRTVTTEVTVVSKGSATVVSAKPPKVISSTP